MATPDSSPLRYGLIGSKQATYLDTALASVGTFALVAYVGSGPNARGEINNLAAAIGRVSRMGRLVVIEYRRTWCLEARRAFKQYPYPKIRIPVHFVTSDITRPAVTSEAFDFMIALGLLGDLRDSQEDAKGPERDPTQSWRRALNETARLLKPGGIAVFGNASARQPLNLFISVTAQAGLAVVEVVTEEVGPNGERRDLVVLKKQAEP